MSLKSMGTVMTASKTLLDNINEVHTTELDLVRIKRNLNLESNDPVSYVKDEIIRYQDRITRKGKNYYIETEKALITVNASSYTIITVHTKK